MIGERTSLNVDVGTISIEDTDAINGFFGSRPKSIHWLERTFLFLGILAGLLMYGFTIARLVKVNSWNHPDTPYGILILVHSIFLIIFLITGIFYQRITDIVAFLLGDVLLTIYSIAYFLARRHSNEAQIVLISSVLINLYDYTGYPTADLVLLIIGIPTALLWLFLGISMTRLESLKLFYVFIASSFFQLGFLIFSLTTGVKYSEDISHESTISTTTSATTPNLLPIPPMLYACISFNFISHLSSIGLGFRCTPSAAHILNTLVSR
ncbi:unnamed protein product [Rotaria sp. Silwood1]|nr:unnamed protein product [Rotaria sp. Silwood1]